jgi:hypothetical protein
MHYPQADQSLNQKVCKWLDTKVERIREIWFCPPQCSNLRPEVDSFTCAEEIISILLHRKFNHQARGKLSPLLPDLRKKIAQFVSQGKPITLFFLYNGGYRASPFPQDFELIFEPDQTELMLLYQASLLQEKVTVRYSPGIDFVIVVNNGVASWVNDIPLAATAAYVSQLRAMIDSLGAANGIRVLLQSELGSFTDKMLGRPTPEQEQPVVSEKEHMIIERFLGCHCSEREARYRAALYKLAEATWGQTLCSMATSEGAVLLRQVAHPHMLSFRPFPGGAIRTQNGSIGFHEIESTLVPRLITSESFQRHTIRILSTTSPLLK